MLMYCSVPIYLILFTGLFHSRVDAQRDEQGRLPAFDCTFAEIVRCLRAR